MFAKIGKYVIIILQSLEINVRLTFIFVHIIGYYTIQRTLQDCI